MKISKEQAYQLSYSKWIWIRDVILNKWGDYKVEAMIDDMPTQEIIVDRISSKDEFIDIQCGCGYCQLYYFKECRNCPLNIEGTIPCFETGHPFDEFMKANNKEEALTAVKKLINLIEQTHEV